MIEIKQTWWHIEDIYDPNCGKKIRQVMDIYSDDPKMPITISDSFLGLRIKSRNTPRQEIGFIWTRRGRKVNLNLNLRSYPRVFSSHNPTNIPNFKHIKLEIEYTLTNPAIENFVRTSLLQRFIDKYISPKKSSYQEINEEIQPELYINLPKGWVISEDGKDIKPIFIWTDSTGVTRVKRPKVEIPFITYNDGKKYYSYYFDTGGYNSKNSKNHLFICEYRSEQSWSIFSFSVLIPILFSLISLSMIICGILDFTNYMSIVQNVSIYLIFVATYATYIFTYLAYLKEGYNMPFNHLHVKLSTVLVFIALILGMFLSITQVTN
jgi:hypothetical protein